MQKFSIPIITYHSIDDSGSVISTSPAIFARQMRFLFENGYSALTLRDLISIVDNDGQLPPNPIVLTFDDGFQNFYHHALPILSDVNFKATVFVVTDFCGRYNDWPGNPSDLPRSPLLSWQEIRELDENGIEFGAHGKNHSDLTKQSPEAAKIEILGSKARLEDSIGRKVHSFAYPYGRFNSATRGLAAANFDGACSTKLGKYGSNDDLYTMNRLDAYYLGNHRVFEMLSTAAFDRYMLLRRCLRSVRSAAKSV